MSLHQPAQAAPPPPPLLACPRLQLKSPRKRPQTTQYNSSNSNVEFLHPGYDDGENILLILPAHDSRGIHYDTALVACSILANSRWDGFLSTTRDLSGSCRPSPSSSSSTQILPAGRYYFCLDTGDINYPVVPSFDHYKFPNALPPCWAEPPIEAPLGNSTAVRDRTCRLTDLSLALEIAHIIPAACQPWWEANQMYRQTIVPEASMATNCLENTMLLRRDIHKLWDDHWFSIVPKAGKWVVHVIKRDATNELYEEYHNQEMQPLIGVGRGLLFARFALAILADQSMFVRQGLSRKLVVLEGADARVGEFTREECDRRFTRAAASRSRSPKKRQRSQSGVANDASSTIADNESAKPTKDIDARRRKSKRRRLSSTIAIPDCDPFFGCSTGEEYDNVDVDDPFLDYSFTSSDNNTPPRGRSLTRKLKTPA